MSDNRPKQVRFESNFQKSDNCWEWQGGLTHNGYGRFKFDYMSLKAHRVSYELYIGEIPEGLKVLHMCDTPSCVNPLHLTVGAQKENVRDCTIKGRRASVLSPKDIIEIRDFIKYTSYFNREVGEMYGVSDDTISCIRTNRYWKAIP